MCNAVVKSLLMGRYHLISANKLFSYLKRRMGDNMGFIVL